VLGCLTLRSSAPARDEDRARLIFYHDDRKLGLHKKK
jgi:hypothetical protein